MYCELQVTSNFSFLRGASHPDELVQQAADLGHAAIAITDRNRLAGIVRAHAAAKQSGIKLIVGCCLDLLDGPSLLALPVNKEGYTKLSNLLTTGNRRAEKGECHLYKADVFACAGAIIFVLLPPVALEPDFTLHPEFELNLKEYKRVFGNDLYLAASRRYHGDDSKYLFRLAQLAARWNVPLVATNDVHYHTPARRQLQDVMTCIREKCTITTAGFRLHPNAERYLKPTNEMCRLFMHYSDAIARTQEIAAACQFNLDELKYDYPEEITSEGRTPQEELTHLAWNGAKEKFGEPLPGKTVAAIKHELHFIEQMNYAAYFLTVYDIVRFARTQNILCQGRGSAANSTVCYCLGITSVNPEKFELLFERFISSARNEPPDIDVDFEHERREEVMQYIFNKYGRDRAAIVATVTQQHQKGALRDVGKAMGLSVDTLNRLSSSIWEFTDEWFEGKRLTEQGLNTEDKHLQKVLQLTREFMGFPRQLGQHTGGFVITKGKLSDLCPIMNARMQDRTCIEWNKDDIDALGFMKIDVLALGMLTCIRKAFDLCKQHYNLNLTLANIPQDDPKVYEMISHADTIGVFQIESRAQQSMLPRLRPKCFYDLVIEVAIVRPGPIQGDMVHPYLRRRNGEEEVDYPSKALKEILERTLGVPLFQEQAMKIAIVAAGFTPTEADELRRSMATFKLKGGVSKFHDKLINGMTERGYSHEYAERVFKQLEGFGSYGFPESHAASFALLVYVSSWLKCYYPDVFACALLNSMPMGFYQPAQIVGDARKHGVQVKAIDINYSDWDNKIERSLLPASSVEIPAPTNREKARTDSPLYKNEDGGAGFPPSPLKGEGRGEVLLGFRQIKGIRAEDMQLLVMHRHTPYTHINQLRAIGLSTAVLERLADADAFRSMGLDRRQALWQVSTKDNPEAMFKGQPSQEKHEEVTLPEMTDGEHVVQDYASTSLSIKAHPVSFIRDKLKQLHICTTQGLQTLKNGDLVKVAGLVLVRQRPGTAGGVCFMTIEDETGFANLVIFQGLFDTYRKEILQARLFMAEGKVQIEGEVIHVIVKTCHDLSKLLRQLTLAHNETPQLLTLAFPDETSIPSGLNKRSQVREKAEEKVFPEARNFR